MDFQKICRLCLTDSVEVINLQSHIIVDDSQETVIDVLNNYFSFQIHLNDDYPQNVCKYCVIQIKLICSFRKIVEHSKQILEKYHNTKVILDHSPSIDSSSVSNEKSKMIAADLKEETVEIINSSEIDVSSDGSSEEDLCQLIKSYPPSDLNTVPSKPNETANVNYLYCSLCDAKFLKSKELLSHCKQRHKPVMSTGEVCTYCQERFPNFNSLAAHTKKHFIPFICPWCWRGFVSSTEYDSHLETCDMYEKPKTEAELNPERCMRQCQHCGKSYPRDYLSVHIKIHGEGQYKCKECSKTFKQPTALYMHMKHVHSNNKHHKCGSCNKAFKCSSSKQAHVRKVHKNERNHVCSSCGKAFFADHGLKKHMLTHTGARSYMCRLCPKTYQARSGLTTHMKSHNLLPM